MKKLVLVAAVLFGLSVAFPDKFDSLERLFERPVAVVTDAIPAADPDNALVTVLRNATAADRGRIVSIYSGMYRVMERDAGARVSNTEKLAELHANTLQLAVDQVGKYPGLDVAIDDVFKGALGTTDVVPVKGEVLNNVLKACAVVVASAQK
jgi:hypothetical protein